MPSTALVTGASRGIGRAIALALAAKYEIVAVARSRDELDALAREIERGGGSCTPVVLNITDADAVAEALGGVRADVLVNNAGVGIMKPLVELTPGEWRTMVATNLDAVYYVTAALLPGMIERRAGHVVIVGSIAGRSAFAGGTCYTATKHALVGFAESLLFEVRDANVKVTLVNPGSVNSSFSRSGRDQSWKLAPEQVADAVAYVVETPPGVLVHQLEIRTLTKG
ncbi:MAG TPA: SDR family oxidoreductase [Gemmatimonadaceae bacterium]|nr:SDR family oxidoreductase [Gemmatimonadaceae bacterium]